MKQLEKYETFVLETDCSFVNVTPVYAALINEDNVEFCLRLPKIPVKIYNRVVSLFQKVAQLYNIECLARIFWDMENEKYSLVVPKQFAGITYVDVLEQEYDEWLLTHIPVIEVHSHGIAFDAFWSSKDDADEVRRNQLYGVFSFKKDSSSTVSLFRCCNGRGDRIIELKKEHIFEDGAFEYDAAFVKNVLSQERILF